MYKYSADSTSNGGNDYTNILNTGYSSYYWEFVDWINKVYYYTFIGMHMCKITIKYIVLTSIQCLVGNIDVSGFS